MQVDFQVILMLAEWTEHRSFSLVRVRFKRHYTGAIKNIQGKNYLF